jgi:hypothetical protein
MIYFDILALFILHLILISKDSNEAENETTSIFE